jgi:hypothetical protein
MYRLTLSVPSLETCAVDQRNGCDTMEVKKQTLTSSSQK